MPDATSLHHCLQNHHQYCIALNINRPVVNLAEAGLQCICKCSTFKAAWVCGQSYASMSHNPTKR